MKEGWEDFVEGHKVLDDLYCPQIALEHVSGQRARCQFVGLLNDTPYDDIVQACEAEY